MVITLDLVELMFCFVSRCQRWQSVQGESRLWCVETSWGSTVL